MQLIKGNKYQENGKNRLSKTGLNLSHMSTLTAQALIGGKNGLDLNLNASDLLKAKSLKKAGRSPFNQDVEKMLEKG